LHSTFSIEIWLTFYLPFTLKKEEFSCEKIIDGIIGLRMISEGAFASTLVCSCLVGLMLFYGRIHVRASSTLLKCLFSTSSSPLLKIEEFKQYFGGSKQFLISDAIRFYPSCC
jgi:hypothetical protein